MGTAAGCDELWARLDSSFQDVAEFRDASLDRWHRKADLASGQSLLRSGGLKALNQPISAQVGESFTIAMIATACNGTLPIWWHLSSHSATQAMIGVMASSSEEAWGLSF